MSVMPMTYANPGVGRTVATPCEMTPAKTQRPKVNGERIYRRVMRDAGGDRWGTPWVEGLQVLHHCDNPACFRWDHLFIGTATDNMRDASTKGRLLNPEKDKTHCLNGHERTEENLYRPPGTNKNVCRACQRQRSVKFEATRARR